MSKIKLKWGKLPLEKKKRLIVDSPANSDSRLILQTFSIEFLRELEKRGYDLKTLKFEIAKQEENYIPLEDDCL